jgi:hypothetical protein
MHNIVGLDWDDINLKKAKKRKKKVERETGCQTILYMTQHGFHLEIIFDRDVSVDENFRIREKFWDCKDRLDIGKRRYKTVGRGHDVLFCEKNGFKRKRIWS